MIRILRTIYASAKAAILDGSEIGKWFKLKKGTHQGDHHIPEEGTRADARYDARNPTEWTNSQ